MVSTFYSIVKETIKAELGFPSVDIESEAENLERVFEIGFKRSIQLLFEYRPKCRIYEVTFQKGVLEIDPLQYRIFSPDDIYQIYPRQMGISFPVVYPRALGLAGLSGQAALGTALVALSTLRSMYQAFALWPSWSIFFTGDPNLGTFRYRIVLEPSISDMAVMLVRETWKDLDVRELREEHFGLTQLEREWIFKFTRMIVMSHLARIRGRFSETLPLGPLEITQDHTVLWEETKEKERELVKELIDFSPPPLPFWG